MTVNDLIVFLQQEIEDKNLPVYLFKSDEIKELTQDMFDLSISDRIDINIPNIN
jgi:hypothetical protein